MNGCENRSFEESLARKLRLLEAASGAGKADLVLKNARYVNVFSNEICCGDIAVAGDMIAGVGNYQGLQEIDVSGSIVLPGLIDAHIHLESSMVSPREFARAVLPHGTTTVITDPHEIANVMGMDGIRYMMQASEGLPVDVRFMLPSCVPATDMEDGAAELEYRDLWELFDHPRVHGLAEAMNYVGVVNRDEAVLKKLVQAQCTGRRIDGHAPGLSGCALNAYVCAGVASDHECSGAEEALEKLRLGQYIMIRQGTAARNLQALLPLMTDRYADRCMFCCDDRHPGDLIVQGHIDCIVREAIREGVDPVLAVKIASYNAARYFHLSDRGAIAPGRLADMVVIDGFESFRVERVFKSGREVYDGRSVIELPQPHIDESFVRSAHDTVRLKVLTADDFAAKKPCGLIGMVGGELITQNLGMAEGIDVANDVLKVAVAERHKGSGRIGLGYIKGYGLKKGAVATTVCHDAHNIIAVGASDGDIAAAVNHAARLHGGIVVVENGCVKAELPLDIAGIMSDDSLENVNRKLEEAKAAAYELGASRTIDPFMTLGFMALSVIPAIRITTRGVFDVLKQKLIGS